MVAQKPLASSPKFAAELAERLTEVMPAGFTVAAEGVSVRLTHDGRIVGSTDMAELVEGTENFDDLPANAASAARAILSNVHDWISHATTEPWPGQLSLPDVDAVVTGHVLEMWWGERDDAVLTLRPLDLGDI